MTTIARLTGFAHSARVRTGDALIRLHVRAVCARSEAGQTTVEYALVLLGVAAVAGLLLAWIRGTDLFEKLFDKILKGITP